MSAGALVVIVASLALNAYFVVVEFALVASRRPRLRLAARSGDRRADAALASIRDLQRQLAGAELGVTVASLGIGLIAEPAIADGLATLLGHVVDLPHEVAHTIAFVVALGIVVFFHMVVAEMVPRNLTIAAPEEALLRTVRPNRVLVAALSPLIAVLNQTASVLLRLVGVRPATEIGTAHTASEFARILDASREEGLLEEFEHTLLSGALAFRNRRVDAAMVPLSQVVVVDRHLPIDEIGRLAVSSGHSRLPVAGHRPGAILGFVHVKDLLGLANDGRRALPLELIRPMLVVGPDLGLDVALRRMRRNRAHLALVESPDGRPLGIVTLEDVLEGFVGDIRDESDRDPR